MKQKGLMIAGILAATISAPTWAAESFTTDQKKEVEKIVHDYLVNHPEVLVEASQALQKKQQESLQDQAKDAIFENAKALFSGKLAVVGNPKGNVTLVEFFDYQCIHCKKMNPVVSSLIEKNKNLRVIYKEFPIFGKNSELASKAALAAAMQGKYQAMHDALLDVEKRLNETIIMEKAKSVGLDIPALKKDMESQEVKDILEANTKLAENMHLMGTPAFIVAATPDGELKKDSQPSFVPGAASEASLQDMIKQAEK